MDGRSPRLLGSVYHKSAFPPFPPILKLFLQDQRGENRKSAIMELKGILVNMRWETHIGVLRPRLTAGFFKRVHQLCTPGQSETAAPPRSGVEEKNEQECGGGGAPAGPPEEEESDGRQLGARHLHAHPGYFVLSLLWLHYFTVCTHRKPQKLFLFIQIMCLHTHKRLLLIHFISTIFKRQNQWINAFMSIQKPARTSILG